MRTRNPSSTKQEITEGEPCLACPGKTGRARESLSKHFAASLLASLCIVINGLAAIPAPDKLLPEDTLVLLTAPNFAKLAEVGKSLPASQCWNDPSMKPFREKFLAKWNEEMVKPLERELGIKLDDYRSLLQGQVTLAITQNGWQGQKDQEPGLLLLVDAKDKSAQLKKNLADLRKKWVDGGKKLRTEKVRDIEFMILPLSSNDVPKTVGKLLPKQGEVQELGGENQKKQPGPESIVVLGQYDSLLLAANSTKALEKVVARLGGGSVPALSEVASYQANHLAFFRDAPLYGWINAKAFLNLVLRGASEKKENPDAPNPFDLNPEKVIGAIGLKGLQTLAFSFQSSREGVVFQMFAGVPESSRQGLFKIIAGEPKECSVPPFVPADAIKFQRWRIDGQKAWAGLEKMAGDLSPQLLSGLNFLLDTANTAARDKEPGFDIRKNLIGNLGDDFVSYVKGPRGSKLEDILSTPSLFLLSSPQPEQLASSLKNVLVYLSQQAGTPPQEREFLGRKVYTAPLRALGGTGASRKPVSLTYAAGSGYVALSTDASMVEEFLRSGEKQGKGLRETAGLNEAAQKVLGPGTSLFAYQNQAETLKMFFEALRNESSSTTAGGPASLTGLLETGMGLSGANQNLKDWLDFSLLPPFDAVAKYFSFTVYGAGATTEGFTLKAFDPAPAALKK